MANREYVINQINSLPDNIVDKIQEFISFQKYSLGLHDSDNDYILSVPNMAEVIRDGLNTSVDKCVPLSEVWPDV